MIGSRRSSLILGHCALEDLGGGGRKSSVRTGGNLTVIWNGYL